MTEPIFKEEEKVILSSVAKAFASSKNPQTIGRNGEQPLINFLNNYLPSTLKAASGHFLMPGGKKSPQIDILVIDTRYPLLGYNTDGTVLVMAHSVIKIIEVKTNLTKKDIVKTEKNFSKISELLNKIWGGNLDSWSCPQLILLAYKITVSQETIVNGYFSICSPKNNHFDISILRDNKIDDLGCLIHFEPLEDDFSTKERKKYKDRIKDDFILTVAEERAPLSDFYYTLIQDSYYTLDDRGYSLKQIGEHFMDYLEWTTNRY